MARRPSNMAGRVTSLLHTSAGVASDAAARYTASVTNVRRLGSLVLPVVALVAMLSIVFWMWRLLVHVYTIQHQECQRPIRCMM